MVISNKIAIGIETDDLILSVMNEAMNAPAVIPSSQAVKMMPRQSSLPKNTTSSSRKAMVWAIRAINPSQMKVMTKVILFIDVTEELKTKERRNECLQSFSPFVLPFVGNEISTTITLPVYLPDSLFLNPILGYPKVTVSLALMAMPKGLPVSVSSPDGMSAANTGLFRAFICAISSFRGLWISLVRPMPKMASMIISAEFNNLGTFLFRVYIGIPNSRTILRFMSEAADLDLRSLIWPRY